MFSYTITNYTELNVMLRTANLYRLNKYKLEHTFKITLYTQIIIKRSEQVDVNPKIHARATPMKLYTPDNLESETPLNYSRPIHETSRDATIG